MRQVVAVAGVTRDDRPKATLTVHKLARLRPAFRDEGSVTAGNSCGISDGAATVAVVDRPTHERLGGHGLRVLATATAGVDPGRPGRGLVPATRMALQRSGIGLDDLDSFLTLDRRLRNERRTLRHRHRGVGRLDLDAGGAHSGARTRRRRGARRS